MRAALLLIVGLFAAPAFGQPPATEYWRPTEAQIAKLEARLVLPDGAAPLSTRARFYSGVPPRGSHRITGLLMTSLSVPALPDLNRPAGVTIVDKPGDWPRIDDGGCGVIHVTYDLATDEVIELQCNGSA